MAKERKRNLSLFMQVFLIIVGLLILTLGPAYLLMRSNTSAQYRDQINERITIIGKLVAEDPRVIDTLKYEDDSGVIQEKMNEYLEEFDVDFIVVMDTEFIRYSHPVVSGIGEEFSTPSDARKGLDNDEFYSERAGLLGPGYRYFKAIYDGDEAIGVVCVGVTDALLENALSQLNQQVLVIIVNLFLVGFIGSFLYSRYLKSKLLDLEPQEISQLLDQQMIVSDSVQEGIIAINENGEVTVTNKSAQEILDKLYGQNNYQLETKDPLYVALAKALEQRSSISNEILVIDDRELLVNINLIKSNGHIRGAVATFQDQSHITQMMGKLSRLESYNDALREQGHRFDNHIQVINGMVELEQFDKLQEYVNNLNHYKTTDRLVKINRIENQDLLAFISEQERLLKEHQVELIIDSSTFYPNSLGSTIDTQVILILSVLFENALDAIETSKGSGQIQFNIEYLRTERVLTFFVEDNGIGMTDEVQARVFERGFSTKGDKKGYGLEGVRRIVDLAGGYIQINSMEGQGTEVYIELPV